MLLCVDDFLNRSVSNGVAGRACGRAVEPAGAFPRSSGEAPTRRTPSTELSYAPARRRRRRSAPPATAASTALAGSGICTIWIPLIGARLVASEETLAWAVSVKVAAFSPLKTR